MGSKNNTNRLLIVIFIILLIFWSIENNSKGSDYSNDTHKTLDKQLAKNVPLEQKQTTIKKDVFQEDVIVEHDDKFKPNEGLLYLISIHNSRSNTKITDDIFDDYDINDYDWRIYFNLNEVPVRIISNDNGYFVDQMAGDIDNMKENFMNFFLPMNEEFIEDELNEIFKKNTEGDRFKSATINYKGINMDFVKNGQSSSLYAFILK